MSLPLPKAPELELTITEDAKMWLVNRTSNHKTLDAGELCGFNVGTFEDVVTGAALSTCLAYSALLTMPGLQDLLRTSRAASSHGCLSRMPAL